MAPHTYFTIRPPKQEMPIFHQPLLLKSRVTPQNVGNSRIIGSALTLPRVGGGQIIPPLKFFH